jgi:Xaa-Pro aminopeptidase
MATGADRTREVLAANEPAEIARRLAKLRERMVAREIDIFYVGLSSDLEYLVGIERPLHHYGKLRFWSGWIVGALIGPSGQPVLMLTRHLTKGHLNELGAPIRGLELQVVSESDDPMQAVVGAIGRLSGGRPRRIAINVDAPAELALNLKSIFKDSEVLIDAATLPGLRAVKSPAELEAMADACHLADETFAEALTVIRPDMTELQLARWVDTKMLALGAVGPSFKTDIWTMGPSEVRAVGERSDDRPIGTGTSLNFDFGAGLRGYCSDFGRTVYMGPAPQRYREAYGLVVASQEEGARSLTPGVRASDVDRAARKVIDYGGYGEWFWHRLGHSIGKDTHEAPFLDVTDNTPLQEGMCFTIEPSIFIPGEFGCRVEDVYVVTPDGGRRLNRVTTELRTI